ncbi:MAG: acetyl-CoA carboxylase, carboxyltransferase subunit beta [Eubacteriales bacterium]|nr:acetyl-CoA carboxylase, carboxyltransferase subunit beta [Eubacteriales bacterium]
MLNDWIKKRRAEKQVRKPDFTRIKTGVNKDFGPKKRGRRAYTALRRPEVPDDCCIKCDTCGRTLFLLEIRENLYRCPKCGAYFMFPAKRRIRMLADAGSFEPMDTELAFVNPLDFPGYAEKVAAQQEKYGIDEAVLTGRCRIDGLGAVLAVCDGRFIMSSMGHNVGEKLTRAIELATREKLALIIYCCSGGARMQEGMISLMQMAKTAAALKRHHDAGLLYISVLTNPTTGGVTASFAMLGDIILAEPNALIGFAGPRVIEQTIGQKLPEGFQRAEFLLSHGFVDAIAPREEQKALLARLIRLHNGAAGRRAFHRHAAAQQEKEDFAESPALPVQSREDPWETVKASRKTGRPRALSYIRLLFEDFTELHGDRLFGEDPAMVAGLAFFEGLPVTVIAQQKGSNLQENQKRNFGMPRPEGYRKALRLIREAESFGRPIVCFVDTPGAYPGMDSEERGQGEAIAACLRELSGVSVPVLSIVLSEGGSGGALALAVANQVWMLEQATYSILSPEGFASILYKDAKRAKEAAAVMKITAADLKRLGVIEEIIAEYGGACGETLPQIAGEIRRRMRCFLKEALSLSGEELAAQRYERFRKM